MSKIKMNKAIPCSSLNLDRSIQNHHPYRSYPFSFVDQNPLVKIDCKVRLHLKSAWPFAYSVSLVPATYPFTCAVACATNLAAVSAGVSDAPSALVVE